MKRKAFFVQKEIESLNPAFKMFLCYSRFLFITWRIDVISVSRTSNGEDKPIDLSREG